MSFYDIHIFLVLNGYLDIELNDDLVIYFCIHVHCSCCALIKYNFYNIW